MRIEVIGVDCPVLAGVTVGLQRGKDVVQEHDADGSDATWVLEAQLVGNELRGPFIHGRPGGRFLYLSWQRRDTGMFRRAKLMLDALAPALLGSAEQGGLSARLSLASPDGSPICAAVRPPAVDWSLTPSGGGGRTPAGG